MPRFFRLADSGHPAFSPWRLALITVMQFSVRGFGRRYQIFNSAEHKEAFINDRLSPMTRIPTPLPPQFVSLANYDGGKRFLEINYQGTKPTICDGTFSSTFPYYDAYTPFVGHLAVALYLKRENAFLGADDEVAPHSLLLDCVNNKILKYIECQNKGENPRKLVKF